MKMWEIREGSSRGKHHGGKSAEEAYECGWEDGYEAAMEELEGDGEEEQYSPRSRKRRYNR